MFTLKKSWRSILNLIVIVLIVILAFKLGHLAQESVAIQNFVQSFGYIGILVIAFISGLNFVVPIPAVAFMPLFLESGFSFWPLIAIIVIGMTLADMVAYWIGRESRKLVQEGSKTNRFTSYIYKISNTNRPLEMTVLALYAAFAPLPNEVVVIPLAFAGYRFSNIFIAVFIGNIIFNILFALGITGAFGLL